MVKHHLHTIDIGDHKTKLYNSKTLTLQITFTKWPALSRICRVIFGRNISATTEIYENVWNCPHNCMQKPFCTMQRLASKNLMAVHNLLHWYIRKDSPFPWNVVKRQSMTSIASISKRFRTVYMNGGKVCCNKPVNTHVEIFKKSVIRRSKMPLLQQTFADWCIRDMPETGTVQQNSQFLMMLPDELFPPCKLQRCGI